jgi:uncharacterized protein YqjF (DUF2071 family)
MKPFLTAEWKNLVMFNYAAEAAVLTRYLPAGTELDIWNNTCYISLVGFMFLHTKVKGIKVPFYSNFEEVNLRFYVRFRDDGVWKRGVVFVKEIVPKRLISSIANNVYGEHYYCYPMRNSIAEIEDVIDVKYNWLFKGEWNFIQARAVGNAMPLIENSEEEFITEHFWGYTKLKNNVTSEYQVQHPRWDVYKVFSYSLFCNTKQLYGNDFHEYLTQQPLSVFMAKGSGVKVYPRKLWKL